MSKVWKGCSYRLRRASKAVLDSSTVLGVVRVSLDQIGHTVLGTATMDNLLTGVVGVHDVGPGHIAEVATFLQLFHGLAHLKKKRGTLVTPIHSTFWPLTTLTPLNRFSKGSWDEDITAPVLTERYRFVGPSRERKLCWQLQYFIFSFIAINEGGKWEQNTMARAAGQTVIVINGAGHLTLYCLFLSWMVWPSWACVEVLQENPSPQRHIFSIQGWP